METLPKSYLSDPDAMAKARSMCARYSDRYISNYLGMAIGQVTSIRRNLPGGDRGRPRVPVGEYIGTGEEAHWRMDAILGSTRLGNRIDEVFGRRA